MIIIILTNQKTIIKIAMMFLPVFVDAPFVRALIRAHLAIEVRLRVHALEFPMPPERSLHRVALAAVHAYEDFITHFADIRHLVRPHN